MDKKKKEKKKKEETLRFKVGDLLFITKRRPLEIPPRELDHYKTHGWTKSEANDLKYKNRIIKTNKKTEDIVEETQHRKERLKLLNKGKETRRS